MGKATRKTRLADYDFKMMKINLGKTGRKRKKNHLECFSAKGKFTISSWRTKSPVHRSRFRGAFLSRLIQACLRSLEHLELLKVFFKVLSLKILMIPNVKCLICTGFTYVTTSKCLIRTTFQSMKYIFPYRSTYPVKKVHVRIPLCLSYLHESRLKVLKKRGCSKTTKKLY